MITSKIIVPFILTAITGILLPSHALCEEPIVTQGIISSTSGKNDLSYKSFFWRNGLVIAMDQKLDKSAFPFGGLLALYQLSNAKNFQEYAACCTTESLPILLKSKKLIETVVSRNMNRPGPKQHRVYLIVSTTDHDIERVITAFDPLPDRPNEELIFSVHIASKEGGGFKVDHSEAATNNTIKVAIARAQWDPFGITPQFAKKLAATTQPNK